MASHEVLSSMKKGSRRPIWGCLRPQAGGRCYREGRGGFLMQRVLKLHNCLREDAEVYMVPKAISQNCGSPFGTIKNEGIAGQEVFGPQMVAVWKHFSGSISTCLSSPYTLPAGPAIAHRQRQGNKPGSPLLCLFLILMYHPHPVPSTFEKDPNSY